MAAAKKSSDTDLIDAHFALYAFLPSLLPSTRHKPWLVHFHGPWAEESLAAGDTSRLMLSLRRALERRVYRKADLLVTLTGAFRQVLVERYGVSPWKVRVIPPGVDIDRFIGPHRAMSRQRFDLGDSDFVVCAVRRLTPRMGLMVLLEAWEHVVTRLPHARLLLAGEGDLREDIERYLADRPAMSSVTFLGGISDTDLSYLYRAADVNVVPSLALEGFGLTVIEAAAAGTPSVVSRVGGLPEAVHALGPDLVVAPGDATELAERLIRAANGDLPSREQTETWADARGWERVAASHREIIRELVTRPTIPSKRLRVVYLDHVARLSGAELALLRLFGGLGDIDAHVILAEDGPLVSHLREAGVSVEVLAMNERTRDLRKRNVGGRLPFVAVLDTVLYSIRLARRLRRLSPDLVHTNSLKAGVYGLIAAKLARKPVIWHLHDRIAREYLSLPARLFVRTLASKADGVICNSEATRHALGFADHVYVIPPPIDIQFSPRPDGVRSESATTTVGMLGRLAPWKGQDIFLRAFAAAFAGGSERGVIVGDALFGEEDRRYAESLKVLVNDLGLAGRIEFRGHQTDIQRELESIDIVVHASTTPEPFGQVVAEGMAAGLPVVASDEGGPREMIDNGVDGVLYPPGDVDALAGHLCSLTSDPQQRRSLGNRAAAKATAYRADIVGASVVRAYLEVLSSRLGASSTEAATQSSP